MKKWARLLCDREASDGQLHVCKGATLVEKTGTSMARHAIVYEEAQPSAAGRKRKEGEKRGRDKGVQLSAGHVA